MDKKINVRWSISWFWEFVFYLWRIFAVSVLYPFCNTYLVQERRANNANVVGSISTLAINLYRINWEIYQIFLWSYRKSVLIFNSPIRIFKQDSLHYITGQWQPCIVIVNLLSRIDVIITIYILFFKTFIFIFIVDFFT
jgi:hypothetical protein